MKASRFTLARLTREMRVAIVIAVLVALGVIALDAGWRASGILALLAATAIAVAYHSFIIRPARIPRDAALIIRLASGIREDAPRSPLEQLRSRGTPTLFHIRNALEAAAADPQLKTVVVEVSAPGFGLATAHELHTLLRALVTRGKRVVAVLGGDQITLRDYLIACGASEVVANPDSAFVMLGLAAGGLFLRDALAKLGVQAQTLQWKEYKGAAEMFSREAMSKELRESLEALIGDWRSVLVDSIAEARRIEPERAGQLLAGGFMSARAAREAGLIDRDGHVEDVRNEIEPEAEDQRRFVPLARYLRHVAYQRDGRARPRLALIHGLGPVVVGEGPMAGEFLSGERIAEEIRRAGRDDSIRAIVFRVNSPGGSAVGSDLVWRAVRETQRRGKPVVVSMGDVAGSGGYYVAMGADAIVAGPATVTGSIGVVYAKFSVPELLGRLGVHVEVAKSDPVSDALSVARPMTEPELAQLDQVIGELYSTFTAKVAEGRRLDAAATEDVARGRVWSGIAAKAHGLVDELGGLGRAVAIAREKAGLATGEEHDLVLYPAPTLLSALNLAAGRAEPPWALSFAARALELPERWAPAMLSLLMRTGALLICPWL
ncbi:MAG TPA: signal peptide peptidase SppA [Candidatus Binataceae bacterium]|nr:signal peptide peptidase SppA [Candidatus Binataceae bacterium]